ncbi:MAG: GH92 family glycosyl hydrolase [Acidobacteria bacterium]|nr:GH92 family glycosyl hydrolase [Acidobacteriota bacterium]
MKTLTSAFLLIFAALSMNAQTVDFTQFVDPFIGTDGTGHTFPGATAPFGMVQPSPDTNYFGWTHSSGYQFKDKRILGFSNTHLNGTGAMDLGDILLQPFSGSPIRSDFSSENDKSSEIASVGYYSTRLKTFDISVELTASERVAFHRYRFDSDSPKHVLIDFQHGLVWSEDSKRVIASDVAVEDANTISGFCETENWVRRKYFFVIKFDKPFTEQRKLRSRPGEKAPLHVLTFDLKKGGQIQAKIAISTVSVEGAKKNLKSEVPHWNFDRVRKETTAKWNRYLSRIDIAADRKQKRIFYTGLYHLLIQPNNIADVDGRYRGADDKVRKATGGAYYSTLSLWDTFRAAHPLYTLIVPERVDGFVNSMLGHFDARGFLPIWTLQDGETHTMIGNHAVPVIVDAYLKGFRGFDAERAFAAIKRSLTVSQKHSDWDVYDRFGYYPFDKIDGESVSRTLESGVDDFAAAALARRLGKTADAEFFSKRADFYRNLFDPETKLMRGKDSNGQWRTPFDPLAPTSPLRNPGDYTEANAWQYSFAPQHAVDGLIALHGGKSGFASKLDRFFERDQKDENETHLKFLGQEGLIGQYAHGNEPSHHIAYLYKFTDDGFKSDELLREITGRFYDDTPSGITGNEDCGQMSAWYIFSVLGFYPVNPSVGEYVLGAPQIKEATVKLAGGKTLRIIADGISNDAKYVKNAKLNGRLVSDNLLRHSALKKGGTLTFEMSANR